MAKQVKARNGGTLTRPDKGETMNPNGRPKSAKFLTELLKKEMDSDAEIIIEGIYQGTTTATPGEKVKVKVKMPTHVQIVQALLRRAVKGDTKAIDMILDRVEGKVPLQLHGDADHPLLPAAIPLTQAQRDKLIDKL